MHVFKHGTPCDVIHSAVHRPMLTQYCVLQISWHHQLLSSNAAMSGFVGSMRVCSKFSNTNCIFDKHIIYSSNLFLSTKYHWMATFCFMWKASENYEYSIFVPQQKKCCNMRQVVSYVINHTGHGRTMYVKNIFVEQSETYNIMSNTFFNVKS